MNKRYFSSKRKSGLIELWVALPVFIILGAGALICGKLLRQRITLEKSSWFQGFHPDAKKNMDLRLHMRSQDVCKKETLNLPFVANLPKSFFGFLQKNCSATIELTMDSGLSSFFFKSGSNFKNSWTLKQLLRQENMFRAGFGILPLSMLGYPEMLEALGVMNITTGTYEAP